MFFVGYLRAGRRFHRYRLSVAIGVVLLTASVGRTAKAQTPLTKALLPDSPPSSAATNSSGIVGGTVQEKLAKAKAELAAEPAGPSDVPLRRSLLERLVQLYEQQINYIPEVEALKGRGAELLREANSWTGFAEPRPYSIFLADNLREAIRIERLEIARGESALSILTQLSEEFRASLQNNEKKIRHLNDELESGKDTGDRVHERELERLRSQIAVATLAVLDIERQLRDGRLSANRVRLGLLERKLVIANAGVAFTEADLQRVRELFDEQQKQAERELSDAENRHRAAKQALNEASEKLRQIQVQDATNSLLVAETQELIELRHTQLETMDTALNVLRFLLQAGMVGRTVWEARFESYRSNSPDTILGAERRLNEFRARIELWKTYYADQLEAAASREALQEQRLLTMDPSSALGSLVRERLTSLRERDQLLLRVVHQIERADQLVQRLSEGLREASGNLPFWGRVRNALSNGRSLLGQFWDLELFTAQDTIIVDGNPITGKRSVTLGKIISAIVILVIGYWLTDLVSRLTQSFVVKRFQIDPNQANLIRRWVRAALVISLALFSLVFVKIPLTIFAFAGGALAIALGFGMQTLLKNFVSGIIILFERPFRVGDVLDVAGQRGTVVGVGIRSSVLLLWDGTETLIPNSTLLENSVTNWTYTDRKVRFTVNVGVAYGSDTRRVVQLLSEVVDRHGLIDKSPQPQILLVDFGPSALVFEIRFWVDVVKANAAQVSSDLRQMIASTFAEHNVTIAFPQQDVHLDASRTLHVQVHSPLDEVQQENGLTMRTPASNAEQKAKIEPVHARL